MAELKSYVCPNCGANTTNAQNCEYCGSLLVRFVEKGIDLSHTSYLNNDAVFPGLVEELKRNLKLQSENPAEWVSTDLSKLVEWEDKEGEYINIMSDLIWADGTASPEFSKGKKQLCIGFSFENFIDFPELKEYNARVDARLVKFRQLDSFPLFTAHNCTIEDEDGFSRYVREYAINFGEDAEGAARLVSEILVKVYGWSPKDPYDMFTNVDDDILRARDEWRAAHGFTEDSADDDSANGGCAGVLLIGLILTGAAIAALL